MARKSSNPNGRLHQPTISATVALRRLKGLLDEVPQIRASGHSSAALSTWETNLKIVLADYYGENSLVFKQFVGIWFSPGAFYPGQPDYEFVQAFNSGIEQASGFLESRIKELEETISEGSPPVGRRDSRISSDTRRIFIIHGHDQGTKHTVARFLSRLGLEPVILHEQADMGRTIMEKFEEHAEDARCAVAILTADDIATAKTNPQEREFRARQNVILELGFFVGKLGRGRTFALVEKGVTLPSDIHGLIYIPLDGGDWQLGLVRELRAAGVEVDANLVF